MVSLSLNSTTIQVAYKLRLKRALGEKGHVYIMLLEFSTAYEKLKDILEWLEQHDIRTHESRISKYENSLRELRSLSDESDFRIKEREYREAMHEYFELSYIYEAFKYSSPAGFASILRKITKGGARIGEESHKNSLAKNFAFEASVGARIGISGIRVYFDTSGDVYFEFEGIPIYIQCKRLSSVSKIETRINQAFSQLVNDWSIHEANNKQRAYGIIAIDITKLINPQMESQIAIDHHFDKGQIVGIVDSYIRSNLREYIFSRELKLENRLMGVILRYSSVSYLQKTQMLNCEQDYTFLNLSKNGSVSKVVMDNLSTLLNLHSHPENMELKFTE